MLVEVDGKKSYMINITNINKDPKKKFIYIYIFIYTLAYRGERRLFHGPPSDPKNEKL